MNGYDISRAEASIKIAGVRLFPAGFRFGPHKHAETEVILVETGICIIFIEEKDLYIHIHEGEGIIIYPDVRHIFIIDDSGSCRISQIMVEIKKGENNSFLDRTSFIKHINSGIKHEKLEHCIELKSCIIRIQKNITEKYLCLLYCAELIMLLSKSIDNTNSAKYDLKNEKLKMIIDYINTNLYEPLVIEDICKQFNISSRYLRKKFQEVTGYNVNNYITATRINQAKELLAVSNLSITQISYQTGFSSSQYFNRVFKKETGITPTQYRIQHYRSKDLI